MRLEIVLSPDEADLVMRAIDGAREVGGVFGAREELVVYQSLRITAGAGESMIFLLFGIGYLR